MLARGKGWGAGWVCPALPAAAAAVRPTHKVPEPESEQQRRVPAALRSARPAMPNFAGTWKMRSSENFDELLKALGETRGSRAAGCGREGTRGGGCSPVSPGRAPCAGRGRERLPPVQSMARSPARGGAVEARRHDPRLTYGCRRSCPGSWAPAGPALCLCESPRVPAVRRLPERRSSALGLRAVPLAPLPYLRDAG